MELLPLVYFSFVWIGVIYLFNCIVAKKYKKIDIKIALLYVTSVILVGVFGEVLVDTLYTAAFGSPLWQYRLLPIHNAHTSYYSLVIWGMYGFYLYLLHDSLSVRLHSHRMLAVLISLEAIVLELLLNFSHFLIFHQYIFYYFPAGLWHLSAFQAIPFYFIAGLVIVKSVHGFKSNPWFFSLMNIILVSVLMFCTQ
jgi:hypothetical protein